MTKQNRLPRIFSLTFLFVRQELIYKYKNDMLGFFWLIIQPLAYIFVYTIVFSNIMSSKLGGFSGKYSYSIFLVSGILIWQSISSILQNMSNVYIFKAPLIKKIPLPLFFIPLYIPIVEFVYFLISLSIFSIFLSLVGLLPNFYSFALVVPIVLTQFLLAYGIGLILAVLSVFISDIPKVVSLALQLLFWATPIVYPISILNPSIQTLVKANPFYVGVASMQNIFFFNDNLNIMPLFWEVLFALFILYIGFLFLRHNERELRDWL